jgi:energy-coupling factor transporter ATP-binding protein EcfA2
MGGYARPIGWIHSLEIIDHFLLHPSIVRFSRCNLIIGNNGSGKTLLLSLIQALSNPDSLTPKKYNPNARISVRASWYDPNVRTAEIDMTGDSLIFHVDGVEAFFPPRPFRTISLREPGWPRSGDLSEIARGLGVPKWVAVNAVARMPDVLPDAAAETTTEDDTVTLRFPGESSARPFEHLSGGQQRAFMMHLIATMGEVQARSEPTMLLLDAATESVDFHTRKYMLDLLSSPSRSFQTIVTTAMPFPIGQEWTISIIRRKSHGSAHVVQELPQSVGQFVRHEY